MRVQSGARAALSARSRGRRRRLRRRRRRRRARGAAPARGRRRRPRGEPAPAAASRPSAELDALCQIIEGVSHFVYVVERARVGREATQLELELQAEVDKWVVLAASMRGIRRATERDAPRAPLRARRLRARRGQRGRASAIASRTTSRNRFVRRLERDYVGRARFTRPARRAPPLLPRRPGREAAPRPRRVA